MVVVAVLFVAPIDPVVGQATSGEFDISVHTFTAPDPFILGADNQLSGLIRNNGRTPTQATWTFSVANDENQNLVIRQGDTPVIGGGATQSVGVKWNGTRWDPGAAAWMPMKGNLHLVFEAHPREDLQGDLDPNPDNNRHAPLTRFLVIRSLVLTPSPPPEGATIPVGEPYDIFVQVRNNGNSDDVGLLKTVQAPPGWEASFSPTSIALPVSSVDGVILTVVPSATAMAETAGEFLIQISSQDAPHAKSTATARTPPVRPSGNMLVEFGPKLASVAVGDGAEFVVSVDNRRNVDEHVVVELVHKSGPPGLLVDVNPSDGQTIPVNERRSFAVRVTAPDEAMAGTARFDVRARAVSQEGPLVTAPGTYALTVEPWYGLSSEVLDAPGVAEPGEPYAPRFEVRNLGNAEDSFRFVVTQMPAGWSLPATHVTIAAKGTQAVEPQFSVPAHNPPGTKVVTVRVESAADPSKFIQHTFPTSVPVRPTPQLETTQSRLPILSHGKAEFSLVLKNVGNAVDDFDVGFEIAEAMPSEDGAWEVTPQPTHARLGVGESVDVKVTIESMASLDPSGQDGILVHVTGASRSQNDRKESRTLEAFPSAADLVIAIVAPDPDPPYRDHPATLAMEVVNLGTADAPSGATIVVEFREAGKPQILQSRTVTLDSPLSWRDDENVRSVDVAMPTGVATLAVTATVDPDDAIKERDESNNEATVQVAIRSFSVRMDAPPGRVAEAGQAVSFDGDLAFKVTNLASHAETFRIGVSSTPSWISGGTAEVDLAAGATVDVPINFLVPENPGAEEVTIVVTASHLTLTELMQTAQVVVDVPDTIPPRFVEVNASFEETAAGVPIVFRAVVHDALGVQNVRLFVATPDGTVQRSEMLPTGPGVYEVEKMFLVPGTYKAHFAAEDEADMPNKNDTSATPITLRIHPPEPPMLHLVTPSEGSSLRPGSPIVFSYQSHVPLASARYAAHDKDEPLALSNPLQVPTLNWPDGAVAVRVRATDIFGGQVEAAVNVTVDGTAPRIVQLFVDPSEPVDGQAIRITARIQDASPLALAVVRVHSVGAGARDVPMHPEEDGAYAAEVTWDAAFDTLAVISEDVVGNRGYAERTFGVLLEHPGSDGGSASSLGSDGGSASSLGFVGFLATALLSLVVCRVRRQP